MKKARKPKSSGRAKKPPPAKVKKTRPKAAAGKVAKGSGKTKTQHRAKPPAKAKRRSKAKVPVLVNLEELAELLDLSLPPVRKLVREPGFPVRRRGSNGVPYEFDARAVARWRDGNERRLEAERQARAEQMAQSKLELFGGSSVDPDRATLSPREHKQALEAEVHATNLKRLRGELVDAAIMQARLAAMFVRLRVRLMEIGDKIGRRHDLDRQVRGVIDGEVEDAIRQAADEIVAQDEHARAA